jgi:HEAT repeat protein
VRRLAALALGDIGPEARPAVHALVEALRDGSKGVRRRAAVALAEVGNAAAAPALREALGDATEGVRRAAAGALEVIGPPAGRTRAA